ncbi:LOW QUALITY PROTEIN: conserved hypothetical protein [Leishmania mexicana MHOM/GT/2001/U1103]|uniref:RNA-editing substrate-binding complex 8 protein HEAT repeats domain-containing protein n=1 Tax=Leishmania mexicana (strain MHOM/GT/2001/U1103) TaxID=929439 RepID=E9ATR0_LEIMU|nr:LOW QUALITY PROTEIN: conserved hypothetical protein [Leishmania mexicana MHOM/GT/2001/U1103]CBZ26335.1 conserved hypothetical protein [Leishmania mexicana MHOM/GT/2001/U1103]
MLVCAFAKTYCGPHHPLSPHPSQAHRFLFACAAMSLRRSCGRLQQTALEVSTLHRLLQHTARHPERFELAEMYKLGILLKDSNDTLALSSNTELLKSLASRYAQIRENASPFQRSLLDAVLPRLQSLSTTGSSAAEAQLTTGSSSAPVGAVPVTAHEYFKAIMELAKDAEAEHYRAIAREARASSCGPQHDASVAMREDVSPGRRGAAAPAPSRSDEASATGLDEALGSSRTEVLEAHLTALEPNLRQLSPVETCNLIKTLAKFNYTNYEHAVLLTRRGCEVSGQLKRRELCQVFFNLHKLHTRDSLVAIVNHLLEHTTEMTADDVFLLCQALERQENTSSASQRLLAPLVAQAIKKLPDAPSAAYHRAFLVSMARYNVVQPVTLQVVLRDWVEHWKTTTSERDLLRMFEAAASLMAASKLEGLQQLVERLTELAPTMDVCHMDRAMDLLSMVPMEMSTKCMMLILARLVDEAGRLSVRQVVFILQLLSTYPPAKGHTAVVSMAYAASVRAPSMDTESLESVFISLAMLQLYTDDFFTIAHVLQTQKGGMRSFAAVQELLRHCTSEMAATKRGLGMLANVICTLAPMLNDEELASCRRALVSLGVQDRDVLQGIFARAKKLHRTQSTGHARKKRRGSYDPMEDLL